MRIDEIETPALLIDAEILDRNLRTMADYCDRHHLSLRPHTKTHKVPEIAKMQVRCGATGITVAKLGEAEVMADAGIDDIVVVYPIWGESKWKRLTALAERVRDLTGFRGQILWDTIPRRPLDIQVVYGDASKAKSVLGWQCKISLDEGLRRTIDFWRKKLAGSERATRATSS